MICSAFANGQTITRSYDANYRLTDLIGPALSLHYTRDAGGNITSVTEGSTSSTFNYDALDRLTGVKDNSGSLLESYAYTKTGDRTTKTGSGLATGDYGYQANTHWLTSTGNAARAYDKTGNTTASSQAAGTLGFGYDHLNRLTVVQRDQQTVATYVYNAFGQRIGKITPTEGLRHQYDEQSRLLIEYGGEFDKDYIWLGDVPVAVVDTHATDDSVSTVNYVHADGLNTPRAIADESGQTIWTWSIAGNPFGEQLPQSNGYVYNLRHPGQYFDVESGLFYNVNRYYDPIIGRYTQVDPIGYNGGQASLYAYVGNDPLNNSDPLGLKNVLIGGNLSLIAVGGFTLAGGIYVSWDTPAGFDIGVYGSVGGGIGANLGIGGVVGYVPGSANNISGTTLDINGSGGIFQSSVSASANTPGLVSSSVGLSVGLPAGASMTVTQTGHVGYQDVASLFGGYFNSKSNNKCH